MWGNRRHWALVWQLLLQSLEYCVCVFSNSMSAKQRFLCWLRKPTVKPRARLYLQNKVNRIFTTPFLQRLGGCDSRYTPKRHPQQTCTCRHTHTHCEQLPQVPPWFSPTHLERPWRFTPLSAILLSHPKSCQLITLHFKSLHICEN